MPASTRRCRWQAALAISLLAGAAPAARSFQEPGAAPDQDAVARAVEAYLAEREEQARPWERVFERLTLSGDLRLRQEESFRLDDQQERHRTRARVRAAVGYQVAEGLGTGFRLTPGDPEDPNSPHVTLGDGFDKFDLSLDRAFVDWQPAAVDGVKLTAGKFGHGFWANPVYGELIFDADVQPEGAMARWTRPGDGTLKVCELTAGQYLLIESGGASDAAASVVQAHAKAQVSAGVAADLAVGYYHYQDVTPDGNQLLVPENQGNALVDRNGDGTADDYRSDFGILNPIAALSGTAGGQPLVVSAEWFQNLQARGGRDQGWAAGAAWGAAKKQGDWRCYYQWQVVEQDAVFSPLVQDDFLHGSNFRGHAFGVNWQAFDQAGLHLWALVSARDHRGTTATTDSDADQWRVRLDFNLRF